MSMFGWPRMFRGDFGLGNVLRAWQESTKDDFNLPDVFGHGVLFTQFTDLPQRDPLAAALQSDIKPAVMLDRLYERTLLEYDKPYYSTPTTSPLPWSSEKSPSRLSLMSSTVDQCFLHNRLVAMGGEPWEEETSEKISGASVEVHVGSKGKEPERVTVKSENVTSKCKKAKQINKKQNSSRISYSKKCNILKRGRPQKSTKHLTKKKCKKLKIGLLKKKTATNVCENINKEKGSLEKGHLMIKFPFCRKKSC